MSAAMYLELTDLCSPAQLADVIDTMSDAERITLREELERLGCQKMVRNLYFNYKTQRWI